MAQDRPKTGQDGPKMAPRLPLTAPRRPKMAPMGAQEGFRTASRWSPELPQRTPRAPKTPLASHLGLRAPKFAPDGPKISPEWLPYRPQRLQNDVQVFPSLFHTCCKRVPPFRSDAVRGTLFVPCGAAEKGDIATFFRDNNTLRANLWGALPAARVSLRQVVSLTSTSAEAQKTCKNHRFISICAILRPLDDPLRPDQRGRGRR